MKVSKKQLEQERDYFNNGFHWYFDKYCSSMAHRMMWLIICLLCISLSYISLNIALAEFEVKEVAFPRYFDDNIEKFNHIKALPANKDINIAVANHFISQYVQERETYSSDIFEEENWHNVQNRIRASSSRRVYASYLDTIDTNVNPRSPLLIYGRNRERSIEIEKIEHAANNRNLVTVYFTAIDKIRSTQTSKQFIAEINYFMSDVEAIAESDSNLRFVITAYQIQSR